MQVTNNDLAVLKTEATPREGQIESVIMENPCSRCAEFLGQIASRAVLPTRE